VDLRIVNDVINRTGRIIESQEDVGGWPELKSAPAPKDSDRDGMPDEWEQKNGLDPDNPDDRNRIANDGYTMLEKYLNSY
jgi:pectate lyase